MLRTLHRHKNIQYGMTKQKSTSRQVTFFAILFLHHTPYTGNCSAMWVRRALFTANNNDNGLLLPLSCCFNQVEY